MKAINQFILENNNSWEITSNGNDNKISVQPNANIIQIFTNDNHIGIGTADEFSNGSGTEDEEKFVNTLNKLKFGEVFNDNGILYLKFK